MLYCSSRTLFRSYSSSLHCLLALYCETIGRFDIAGFHLEKAIVMADSQESHLMASLQLGLLYCTIGHLEKIPPRRLGSHPSNHIKALSLFLDALIDYHHGKREESWTKLQISLQICSETCLNYQLSAHLLNSIAHISLSRQQQPTDTLCQVSFDSGQISSLEKIYSMLNTSLSICNVLGDIVNQLRTLQLIGELLRKQGDHAGLLLNENYFTHNKAVLATKLKEAELLEENGILLNMLREPEATDQK